MNNSTSSATQSDREYRKIINAWSLYDWANSAFATTIMAAIYPVFYRSLATASGKSPAEATAYWAYTTSFSLLLIAVLGPVLGTLSDCTGGKKRYIGLFAGIGILGTALMIFLGDGAYLWGSFLFLLGNIGFAGGNVFYESLLPSITRKGELDRVSARGYALGYFGGGILLVVHLIWLTYPQFFFMPDRDFALRAAFFSVALWWGIFSVPLFLRVPEPPGACPDLNFGQAVGMSFRRLAQTFREIKKYKQLLLFLIAFWIYNDAIGTIIKIATAFGDEIGIDHQDMFLALIITQFVGVPCAFGFGWLGGKIGTKRSILLGLFVYIVISAFGYFMQTAAHFYFLAFMVGLVQGGTQALSRSMFASMVPQGKAAEFFGFYSTGAKFAGIVGPFLFGAIAQLFGDSRPAILFISGLFFLGGFLLLLVNQEEGMRVAEEKSENP